MRRNKAISSVGHICHFQALAMFVPNRAHSAGFPRHTVPTHKRFPHQIRAGCIHCAPPHLVLQRTPSATAVAKQAKLYGSPEREIRAATVNGAAGAVIFVRNRPFSVMAFVVSGRRVTAIDVIADPARVHTLDLSAVTR